MIRLHKLELVFGRTDRREGWNSYLDDEDLLYNESLKMNALYSFGNVLQVNTEKNDTYKLKVRHHDAFLLP